jgi:hypothetical protein
MLHMPRPAPKLVSPRLPHAHGPRQYFRANIFFGSALEILFGALNSNKQA